jgi:hypothetical protein
MAQEPDRVFGSQALPSVPAAFSDPLPEDELAAWEPTDDAHPNGAEEDTIRVDQQSWLDRARADDLNRADDW